MKTRINKIVLAISAMLLMNGVVHAQDHRPHSSRHSHTKQRSAPPSSPKPRFHATPRQRYSPAPSHLHNYRPGYRVSPLPRGASRVVVNRSDYYCFDGFYYQPFQSGYIIVDAPIGAVITVLPILHHRVNWRGAPYFVVGNTFYRNHPRGYIVVANPGIVLWR